jgi:hypothetical protein
MNRTPNLHMWACLPDTGSVVELGDLHCFVEAAGPVDFPCSAEVVGLVDFPCSAEAVGFIDFVVAVEHLHFELVEQYKSLQLPQ